MKRSFGPMGGGGGMMTTVVHRAVRAASGGRSSSHDPCCHSTNISTSSPTYKPSSDKNNDINTLSFSSGHHDSPFSSVSHPNWPRDDQYDHFVLGTVPSKDEVHHAVSSLQQCFDHPTSSHHSGWELDWIEPPASMLKAPASHASQSVYDAFCLLRTEPSVKRMVISLSSDKTVWDAVMNNEAVRDFRDSVYKGLYDMNDETGNIEAEKSVSGRPGIVKSSDGSVPVSDVLHRIFINTLAKVVEIVEKTGEMVSKLFQSPRNEKKAQEEGAATEAFEKKLRSCFFLSVMVLLIVVVSRAYRP